MEKTMKKREAILTEHGKRLMKAVSRWAMVGAGLAALVVLDLLVYKSGMSNLEMIGMFACVVVMLAVLAGVLRWRR